MMLAFVYTDGREESPKYGVQLDFVVCVGDPEFFSLSLQGDNL